MKKIYILLMHTNTIPAKIIKFVTRYEYSHVGISLQKDCNIIYSFGRRKFNSILNAGFCIEYKDGKFFEKFNKTMCRIYEVEVTDKQYEDIEKIINKMKLNMNEYKYDYIGIVARFLGIPIILKHKYVCSYFVATILQKTNVCKFDKKTCFIRPKDFENIKGFNNIYTGSYMLYK